MALLNRDDSIQSAWRALAQSAEISGWRTINIDHDGICKAGMRLDDRMEAILFGFKKTGNPSTMSLPEGHGFSVTYTNLPYPDNASLWIALIRSPDGNPEMFATMAADIFHFLEPLVKIGHDESFRLFLGRVRAWQNFMRSRADKILGPEDETGLFGELLFLRTLMDHGISGELAIQSWKGPFGGVHDFSFGTGAVEVKTTTRAHSFIARIPSLAQLDDSTVNPLYLCATRLQTHEEGMTLPDLAQAVADGFSGDSIMESCFYNAIISAGLHLGYASSYHRRFKHVETFFFNVDKHFPRLTPQMVHASILKVVYQVNLDGLSTTALPLSAILESTGVCS